jgi:alpha-tubulin suppressor-like RCC1 family protein
MRRSSGLLATAVLISGCLEGRYVCRSSSECEIGDVTGVCEPTGFCSFSDPTCPPSDRRYGELADASHRGRCVDLDGGDGCIRSLASGGLHNCLVKRDGTAWCWGANQAGQLGNGGFASSAVPLLVIDEMGRAFGDVQDIDAGFDFTCARRTDQTLWCWGNGRRVGAGDVPDQPHPRQVTTVDGLLDAVVQVSAGTAHACAVRDDHAVWCWGANDSSQLGDGSMAEQLAASPVRWADHTVFDSALLVAAGAGFTCASRPDNLWCWGDNMFAQLGQPGGPASSPSPVVALPVAVTAIAAGGAHACAVAVDRSAWCWGRTEDGQIGEPDLPGVGTAPVQVWSTPAGAPLAPVVSVAAGEAHSCASTADGRAHCWGAGDAGQLGNTASSGAQTPVEVQTAAGDPLGDIVAVAAGIDDYHGTLGRHSCARQRDAVWCWGIGDEGVLGNGQMQSSAVAVPVDLSAVCP